MELPQSQSKDGSGVRLHAALILATTSIWQAYVAVAAFRHAETLKNLTEGLGAELPMISISFLSSYWAFGFLPICTLVMVAFVHKKSQAPLRFSTYATIGGLLIAFFLQAWTTEAFFQPLFSIVAQIG